MSNIYKAVFYATTEMDTRVIDNNELIYQRVEQIKQKELSRQQQQEQGDGEDAFTLGLNAEVVDISEYEHEESPEEMLERINQSAQEILDKARLEADSIRQLAEHDAAAIRKKAQIEGNQIMQLSKDQGYELGLKEATTKCERQLQQREEELAQYQQNLQMEYEQKFQELEPMLVETIVTIVNDMVHFAAKEKKDMILSLVHSAFEDMDVSSNYILRVSKEDAAFLRKNKDKIDEAAGSGHVEIVEDASLKNGQCLIDTDIGIYDCSLDTQMEGLLSDIRMISCVGR